jgi:hypothetical protein
VFRCTRKNKCEQFLSEVAVHHIGNSFRNIEKDGPTQDIESFYNFTKQQIKIDFKNVVKFMRRKENEDYLWNEYAPLYENYTLYYEDMSVPFDIPVLNLYNIMICMLWYIIILTICVFLFLLLKKEYKEGFENYLNGIDIVYWINLDRSPDRRKSMEKMFKDCTSFNQQLNWNVKNFCFNN